MRESSRRMDTGDLPGGELLPLTPPQLRCMGLLKSASKVRELRATRQHSAPYHGHQAVVLNHRECRGLRKTLLMQSQALLQSVRVRHRELR